MTSYAEGQRVEFDQSDAPTRMGTIVRVDTLGENYFNVVIKIDGRERLTGVCTAYGKHVRVLDAPAPDVAQGRTWALRHLDGECDSRGTCQPVPASAERPANLDFFEWVGALWCDEREAHSTVMGVPAPVVAPLHPRLSNMFGTAVHAPHVDPSLGWATLCGASKRPTDHAERTTDDIDCPVCLRMVSV